MERLGGRQAQAAGGRARRWGLARAGRAGAGWRQAQACRQACGSRRADTAGTRGARAAAGAGARGACGAGLAGRKARGLGAGRAGWPWAVHSVHSAHFRSVLTRFFFSKSPNEHCSL